GGPAPNPPSPPRDARLKSEASHAATLALGTVIGLIAAMALADTPGGRPVPAAAERPSEQVAAAPVVVVPPSVADSASAAPTGSSAPPPVPSPDPELAEQTLVEEAQRALRPPDANPEKTLRLLDLHARLYPQSRRFLNEIARLRREARRLTEKRDQPLS